MSRTLWPLLSGFAIWAVAFVLLYAVQAVGCLWSWPEAMHRSVLVALWIASLAALGLLLAWQRRGWADRKSGDNRAAMALTLAALAATVASYFPVAFVSLCV